MATDSKTKKFGKSGSRTVPDPSQRAKRWYPANDEPQKKKVRKSVQPTKLRESLQPGTILILLAGRFRGKRVILLKHLDQGVLLVSGPFKINGVPLRRVNARYVIATSQNVDLKGLDAKTVEKVSQKGYFTEGKTKRSQKGEDAFFKQGEKAEVWLRPVPQLLATSEKKGFREEFTDDKAEEAPFEPERKRSEGGRQDSPSQHQESPPPFRIFAEQLELAQRGFPPFDEVLAGGR